MTARTPSAQQPKEPEEYTIHRSDMEESYDSLALAVGKEYADNMWSVIALRSRPHPAPAFKRCCDSCINVPCKVLNRVPCLAQEKQENICEENGCTDVENCDEICQHSRLFSPLQMQEAKEQAARRTREDVLDLIDGRIEGLRILFQTPKDERTMTDAELLYAINEIKIIRECVDVESLRGQDHD